jgi:hypothetical protein
LPESPYLENEILQKALIIRNKCEAAIKAYLLPRNEYEAKGSEESVSEHLNPQGKRKTATLYVGNLEYNSSVQDLSELLGKVFRKIRVEKITIPKVQGRSKYGFIQIIIGPDIMSHGLKTPRWISRIFASRILE